jgi:RimJ/RimL family protein N-acetyltransferase
VWFRHVVRKPLAFACDASDAATMTTLADLWPPAGLRVTSGDLELRMPDEPTLIALAELATRGVHPADEMPFYVPWTRGTASEVALAVLRYQWSMQSRMSPEDWGLDLAVLRAGQVVGKQSIFAKKFPLLRTAESGSWLGREFQGQGIGLRMRLLILHLLFDGLDAQRATTGAFSDNPASNAVTHRIGYEPNGSAWIEREGRSVENLHYVLTRDAWERRPDAHRLDVEYVGLDAVREFLQVS